MENYTAMSTNTQERKTLQTIWINITKASLKAGKEFLKTSKQNQYWDEGELVKLSKERKASETKL